MRKQISAMEIVILAAMALVALIVVYAAGRQLSAPDLPVIQSSGSVISKDVETADAPQFSSTGSETRYSAVVINPATGQAEAVEYAAPRLSSIETEAGFAGSGGEAQYSAVVINPATGQAQAVEYNAPRLGHVEMAGSEGEGQYSTVVVDSATGRAEMVEWTAPQAK